MKDSAPEKWEYKEHTKVKHILLEKYLTAWIPILGRWNPTICYFDGFAGKGQYHDGTLGSPLIALRIADKLSNYFGKLICFFIEKDRDNFENLQKILERERPNVKNWQKIEVILQNEEFANVAGDILKYLEEKRSTLVPSFFFIDPFGFSGIPFSIVQKILSNPRTEMFFTLMVRDMMRFLDLPNLESNFNTLFGTEQWKAFRSMPDCEILLRDLYRKQLHEEANVKYSLAFRVCASEKLQSLYYLIHATNNHKGHSIMKSVMFNQSARGNFAYLGPQDTSARLQMRLFSINEIGELKRYLLERFEGKSLRFDELLVEVCRPWQSEPPYIEKHYREALKELEEEKKVKVERVTSKRKGMRGQDRITFLKIDPAPLLFAMPKTEARPKVYYKEFKQLDGRKQILVDRVGDGSIISRFDKTALPQQETDVICPHFLELKWAYGCPFNCSWCYLKGTFRFRPEGIQPKTKDFQKIESHTRTFLEEVKTPEILNSGEIADSLMAEAADIPFSKFIIPIFASQNLHRLLFLSKSSNVRNLLELRASPQVILSFSLNAIPVAERWEKAPHVLKRIEAAREVYEAGYEVRIRIDPMVPIEKWQEHYAYLVDVLFEKLLPERITLGSLRGLQSTINGCTDKSWVKYLKESSNWGRKMEIETRYAMYSALIERLEAKYEFTKVALCKETVQIWDRLKMNYRQIRCNCV